MKSGTTSSPLDVSLSVTGNKDTTATKTSNKIDATIKTHEVLDSANKQGTFSDKLPSCPSCTFSEPAGFDESKYWYVDWYGWAAINGNQPFKLDVTDQPQSQGSGLIIGNDIPNAVVASDHTSLTANNVFSGYVGDGTNFFYHVIMAYPLSELKKLSGKDLENGPATIATEKNNITYKLTPLDEPTSPQSKTGSATQQYRQYPYNVGASVINASKNGRDLGQNTYGLNRLANGHDLQTAWDVSEYQQVWSLTKRDGSDAQVNPDDPKSYGQKDVTTTVTDDQQYFDQQEGDKPLTPSEIEFTSIDFTMPLMQRFTGTETHGYSYEDDPSITPPNTEIWMYKDGSWVDAGTVSYRDGITVEPKNGAGVDGTSMTFPKGVSGWKAVFTSKAAGETWSAQPHVTLHPVGRVLARAKSLIQQSRSAQTTLYNHATAEVTTNTYNSGEIPAQPGVQTISAAAQWAGMSKTGSQNGTDRTNRTVTIDYTVSAHNTSNITDKTVLDSLISRGILNGDTSGRFYDLLPLGYTVDASSVTVDGSAPQGVRLVNNWRGSGRTMMIVSAIGYASYDGDGTYSRTLRFSGTYGWTDMTGLTDVPKNNAAYMSDSKQLGTVPGSESEPDDPAGGKNSMSMPATAGVTKLMSKLEPDNAGKVSTLYASTGTSTKSQMYSFSGIHKDVSAQGSGKWGRSATVSEGQTYSYRLTDIGSGSTTTSNIILADNIENYTPNGDDPDVGAARWKGTFQSVDTSRLSAKGIAPVIYYRSTPFDTAEAVADKKIDLSNGWTTSPPDHVSAIAIDCSKGSDGKPFVLGKDDNLYAQIIMRAPTGSAAQQAEKKNTFAFNQMWMANMMAGTPHVNHAPYTKVSLSPLTVTVTKLWDDEDNRDAVQPKSVTVRLLADGKDIPHGSSKTTTADLDADNHWTASFAGLPTSNSDGTSISYTATDSVSGYSASSKTTVNGDKITIALTNHHDIATTSINGIKKWVGGNPPSQVTFELYADGKDTGQSRSFTGEGNTWNWTWGDLPKNRNVNGKAVPIVYTVREVHTNKGWKNDEGYDHFYTSGSTITNTWNPYGDITLTKSVFGTTPESAGKSFAFTLTLQKPDGSYDPGSYAWTSTDGRSGTIGNGQTVTLKAGQSVTVHKIPMGEKYTWTEAATDGFTPSNPQNLAGTVVDNTNTKASVTNVYATKGSLYVSATKTLTGRKLRPYQFAFTIKPVTGSTNGVGGTVGAALRTTWNDKDGNVNFSALTYTNGDAGKTYWYQLTETPYNHAGYTSDPVIYRFSVTVQDLGTGKETATPTYYRYEGATQKDNTYSGGTLTPLTASDLTFKNSYKASGTLPIQVQKVLAGGSLSQHHFTFDLSLNGQTIQTAKSDDQGTASFKKLSYTQDDSGKTFVYTLSEENDGQAGVVYDGHKEQVSVTVNDNGDGTLSMDEQFTGKVGQTPLVWRNSMTGASLKVSKTTTSDTATVNEVKKDNPVFPMRLTLQAPQGGTLTTPLKGSYAAKGSTSSSDKPYPVNLSTDRTSGYVDFTLKSGDSVSFTGLPAGTTYLLTEEDQTTSTGATG